MKAWTPPDNLKIAPGYTVGCWKSLKLTPDVPDTTDWKKALAIFDARIRRRFLDPVDELIKIDKNRASQTFGFAILAIDFLVIETLQGFRDGVTNHNRKSERLITSFLTRWNVFKDCLPSGSSADKLTKQIYEGYRCALHHSGATDGALRVGVSGPVFDFKDDNEVKINRTCLHKHLVDEFGAYQAELGAPDGKDLRCKFVTKMNFICGVQSCISHGQ